MQLDQNSRETAELRAEAAQTNLADPLSAPVPAPLPSFDVTQMCFFPRTARNNAKINTINEYISLSAAPLQSDVQTLQQRA